VKLFDFTFPSPAENLACDEALLDWCESSGNEEVLRFWESPTHFVVVGYANRAESEVNVAACEARNIPILRRCSGGGTVVQGPGCLSYTLVLRITADGPTRNISSANLFIMERNCKAIESAIGNRQSAIRVCGHTDLSIDGRKFSGNSQRRRRRCLLFHGTFLLDFDLKLIGELLRMPSLQPDYREGRGHDDFVRNLNVPLEDVKAALRKSWEVSGQFLGSPQSEIAKLVDQKYSKSEWNLKF
jgi:lipoate-protein ligase A